MSELDVLFPKPLEVQLAGRSVKVKPVQLKHFEGFAKASAELIEVLSEPTTQRLFAFASKRRNLLAVLRVATDLSAWRILRLPTSTAVELMVLAVRVNASFFDAALVSLAAVLDGQKSPHRGVPQAIAGARSGITHSLRLRRFSAQSQKRTSKTCIGR